jgi:hypothetical protein
MAPRTFTAKCWSKCSGVVNSKSAGSIMPALNTSASLRLDCRDDPFNICRIAPVKWDGQVFRKGEPVSHEEDYVSPHREVPCRQSRVELTIGIDLGNVWSHYCTLNQDGEAVDRGRCRTTYRSCVLARQRRTQSELGKRFDGPKKLCADRFRTTLRSVHSFKRRTALSREIFARVDSEMGA